MIGKVVNGQLVNLAGASAGGLPVGSILALHTNRVPSGYLPCNGATYDIAQYPALYTILQTNVLPDLREMNLVGTGTNSTQNISTHDVYTLGQFKDDQVQETITCAESTVDDPGHWHRVEQSRWVCPFCQTGGPFTLPVQDSYDYKCQQTTKETTGITVDTTLCCDSNSRIGSTTHGKNYGVFYVIKAVTGITELDDAEVYGQIVDLLEANYIQKSLFSNDGIPVYNSTTECFDQITPPSCNGLALSYDVTNCCYCWGETASAVSNLTDVCLNNLSDGQYLQYDATTCTWNNTTLTVDATKICTQANCGCAYACTWCSGDYACMRLFNNDDCNCSCIDAQPNLIKQTVCYSDWNSACNITCVGCSSFTTHIVETSGDDRIYTNMCLRGGNVTFCGYGLLEGGNCCGGCLKFNSICSMCYDGDTGILYVHAICFI